jgi:hypothetical protein
MAAYGAVIGLSALAALLFDLAAHRAVSAHTGGFVPYDFDLFWRNARAFSQPVPDITPDLARLYYPPPFLLLTTPFSWLPEPLAYIAWDGLGLLALAAAARRVGWSWRAILVGLACQPVFFCITLGQSGLFVSALLVLALGAPRANPALAGVAAGLCLIKPQFGLLLPAWFFTRRCWRAIVAAVLAMAAASVLLTLGWGSGIWHNLGAHAMPGARGLLQATWPSGFQTISVTPFVFLRSLRVGLSGALLAQAGIALAAMAALLYLPARADNRPALVAACLVPLATPYAMIYDLPFLALSLAALWLDLGEVRGLAALALLDAGTSLYPVLSKLGVSLGAPLLVLVLWLVWPKSRPEAR